MSENYNRSFLDGYDRIAKNKFACLLFFKRQPFLDKHSQIRFFDESNDTNSFSIELKIKT